MYEHLYVCACLTEMGIKNPDSATYLYEVNKSNSMATDLFSAYTKRCPGIGILSRADWEIGVFRQLVLLPAQRFS